MTKARQPRVKKPPKPKTCFHCEHPPHEPNDCPGRCPCPYGTVKPPKPCMTCKGTGLVTKYSLRQPFNPGSPGEEGDVGRLITSLKLKMPKKRGEDRFTTEQKYLKRFAKKHPVFRTILDCREKKTAITRYIYNVNSAGCVTTQYGFHPSTWRKSSRNDNLQNIPIRNQELAEAIRGTMVARPGHVLVEADYCVAPNTRVLKADLTWARAIDLKPEEELIAFEEKLHREMKFVPSRVIAKKEIIRPRVAIHTTHGSIVVSTDHQFVARCHSYKKKWVRADKLRPGMQMTFLAPPWEVDESRDAGYLAGFFDGEGWVHNTTVGYAQNWGPTLDRVSTLLAKRGHDFRFTNCNSTAQCRVSSNMAGSLRFLGSIRPPRLMTKARQMWEGRRTWGKRTPVVKVTSVEFLEEGPVIAIETTTGTLITEGFFSHNCGIEAVIVGVLAGDKDYIRICKAGLHGFTASRWMGNPLDPNMPFEELQKQCKAIKKLHPEDYDRAKRGNHGVNYLLSPYGLNDEHPEAFPTLKSAKEYQDLYFGIFPKIRLWHQNILRVASKQTFLDNHYGIRHYFYNVLNWNPDTREYDKLGDDAKRAVAFIPQSDGSCIQNIDLLELASDPIIEPCLRLVIHDSKVLEVPLELVDYACQRLHSTMSRPRPELGGESIGVEIAIGTDLRKSAMDTWRSKEEVCTNTNVEASLPTGGSNLSAPIVESISGTFTVKTVTPTS